MSGISAAVVAVVAVVGAVAGAVQQADTARKQEHGIRDAAIARNAQLAIEQKQSNDKATAEMSDRAKAAMIEQSRIQVVQAESGLTGLSNDRVLGESRFNESFDIARIEGNRGRTQAQLTQEGIGGQSAAQSRLNAVKQPSLIGTGLQIVTAATDYSTKQNKYNSGNSPG